MAQASSPGGVLHATSVTATTASSAGISGTLNAVLEATERKHLAVPVTVGVGTLGAAARMGLRGVTRFVPYVGLALTVAELSGWEVEGEWFNLGDGTPSRELEDASYYICAKPDQFDLPAQYCVESARRLSLAEFMKGKGCLGRPGSSVVDSAPLQLAAGDNWTVRVVCRYPDGSEALTSWLPQEGGRPTGEVRTPEYNPGTPVTDAQMVQAMANLGPEARRAMLHDANGVPHNFPEIQDGLNRMAAALEAKNGAAPDVDGVPLPTDELPGGPASAPDTTGSDLPAFCEWAMIVCDFIEWVKEDPPEYEKKLVEWDEDQPEEQHFTAPIPDSGTCPAPEVATIWGQEVDFSYSPICDFAEYLRPLLLLAAGVAAAYIVAGVRNV